MKICILLGLLCATTSACFSQTKQPAPAKNPQAQVFRPANADAYPVDKLYPVGLPDGRVLVAIGDTVHMLDASGKEIWRYTTGGPTFTSEPAYNPAINEVALTGYDLLFVRLDATTGKLKWKADSNGRAGFMSVSPYGRGFLVVVSMWGYRENDKGLHLKNVTLDSLDFWGESDKDFWTMDFPIDADLLVAGENIYAVNHQGKKVTLQKLNPPHGRRSR